MREWPQLTRLHTGSKRRVALGLGLIVALAVAVGFAYLHRDASPSAETAHTRASASIGKARASAAYRASHLGEMDLRIAYGSTPKQVVQQIGAPTRTDSGCWLYTGRVGSIRGRYSGPYIDAMKFCFGQGSTHDKVMIRILSHMVAHTIIRRDPLTRKVVSKQAYPAEWGNPVTIIQPPAWYYQESS